MNNKLSIQDLASAFAEKVDMDAKSANIFVKTVFEIVEEYIATDKEGAADIVARVGTVETKVATNESAISTLNTEVASKASQVSIDNIQTQLDNLIRIFIGTREAYETANANGEIPVNAIVIITDDETPGGSSDQTSSVLGKGVLGYLILG